MSKSKTKQRLPAGVVQKIQENTGGGCHRDKKRDYKRHAKHRHRDVGESFDSPSLYSF
jgi:hypothetical protein